MAVDPAGNVFVTDTDNSRVMLYGGRVTRQTVLPFTGVSVPWGIAVDNAGTVYVTEHDANQVMKLVSGSNTPTVLPFTGLAGLNTPLGVTVDKRRGTLYVADRGNDRVLKLVS